MDKKKYIIFKNGSVKIFDCTQIHLHMSNGKEVISAGFLLLDQYNYPLQTFGGSLTLRVESRKEDLQIIRDFLKK